MISVQEAIALVLRQETSSSATTSKVPASIGCYLAEDIIAPFDLPSFDNSAMDGYAVCGTSPSYTIIGEVAAGDTQSAELNPGEAMRIFTGGKVPANTTAVIMQEKTEVNNNVLQLSDEVVKGKNIRRKGEEIQKDKVVFNVGQLITPALVGQLNSLGFQEVQVFQKPNIRLIMTGNELVTPGQPLKEGQIYESNGATIVSALQSYGFDCSSKVQIKDDYEAVHSGISKALDATDVLLISGGISVGDYDYVKQALEENGVVELFYKVKQKPGKPLYFGRREDTFVFALPGNPASALTCFYVYVMPLLQKISGGKSFGLHRIELPLSREFEMKSDRPTFFKARIAEGKVELLHGQGSSMLHSMAIGNALAFIDKPMLFAKDQLVECWIL